MCAVCVQPCLGRNLFVNDKNKSNQFDVTWCDVGRGKQTTGAIWNIVRFQQTPSASLPSPSLLIIKSDKSGPGRLVRRKMH